MPRSRLTTEARPASARKRRLSPKPASLYTTHADKGFIGKALVVRRDAKGKGRAVDPDEDRHIGQDSPDEGDEGERDGEDVRDMKEAHVARTTKGWESRKARAAERSNTPDWDPGIPLPSDDLLLSLLSHSSTFLQSHSLILSPHRRPSQRPIKHQWPSAKRRLLNTESTAPTAHLSRPDGSGSASRSGPSWAVASPPRNASSGEEEDSGEDEIEHSEEEKVRERSGGAVKGTKYKKRDMYKALDGTALLALGVLVEEYISRELDQAGYEHREEDELHPPMAAVRNQLPQASDDDVNDDE